MIAITFYSGKKKNWFIILVTNLLVNYIFIVLIKLVITFDD